VPGLRVERLPPVGLRRVGLRVGVRVVDPPQLPAALLDVVEHLQLLLRVEPVGHRARVRVPHRVDLLGPPVPGRDQPTGLVGELLPGLPHDLVEELTIQLDHGTSRILPTRWDSPEFPIRIGGGGTPPPHPPPPPPPPPPPRPPPAAAGVAPAP